MSQSNVDQRLASLEKKLAELESKLDQAVKRLTEWFKQLDSAHDETVKQHQLARQAIRDMRTLVNKGALGRAITKVPANGPISVVDPSNLTQSSRVLPPVWDGTADHCPTEPKNICQECGGSGSLFDVSGRHECPCMDQLRAAMQLYKTLMQHYLKKRQAVAKTSRSQSRSAKKWKP